MAAAKAALEAAKVYFRLFQNRRYAGLMLTMSLLTLPFFGFIAGSSEIYITRFGLDERQFGYFFGFNALALMFGPIVFTRLVRSFSSRALLTVAFAGIGFKKLMASMAPMERTQDES